VKKILFLFVIILATAFALYKADIKPQVKEVVKDVAIEENVAK